MRQRNRAFRVGACSLLMTGALLCGVTSAVATPPVNPSNDQISQAQAAKQAMAAKVGDLAGQVAGAQAQLQQLSGQAEQAEQKYAYAVSQLQQVQAQAAQAQKAIAAAEQAVTLARTNLTSFVHDSYIQPAVSSGAGNLLTAHDPNALLQQGDYVHYVSTSHLDALAMLDRATVARSNAVAAAKGLVIKQQQLTLVMQAAQTAAIQALQAQKLQTQQVQATLTSAQGELATAQASLATLNGQRATYDAYVKKQAEIAAAKARAEAAARLRAQQQAALIAQQNAAAAAARNSAGNSAQSGNTVTLPAPASGNWTAAKGRAAAARALTELGMPYAWAGGGNYGPTYGVNSPGTDGWNDSQVYGFDCSGLVMYAWAPQGLYLSHYAASQYTEAGSYHPSAGDFQPGDLLFWSSDGTIGGIHHVAIYIGNGNVVQAPNSGSIVQITPWDQVDGGYLGATRPLT